MVNAVQTSTASAVQNAVATVLVAELLEFQCLEFVGLLGDVRLTMTRSRKHVPWLEATQCHHLPPTRAAITTRVARALRHMAVCGQGLRAITRLCLATIMGVRTLLSNALLFMDKRSFFLDPPD